MGARTRGIANNILSDGLDATDGLSGALPSSNIANASVTNVTSTPSIGGGFEKVASDPPSPTEGDIWFNTTSNTVKGYVFASLPGTFASGGNLNSIRGSSLGSGTLTAGLNAGGYGPTATTSAVEEYNGTSWTNANSLGSGYANQLGGGGSQTSTLVFGGYQSDSTFTNRTEEYDGTNWTSGGSYPTNIRGADGGGPSNTTAFGGGGEIGNTGTNAFNYYDGSTWTAAPANPSSNFNKFCGTQTAALAVGNGPGATQEWDGSAWTAGGANLSSPSSSFGMYGSQTIAIAATGNMPTAQQYDGSSWTAGASPSVPGTQSRGTSESGTTGFFAGGYNPATATRVNTTEEYTAGSEGVITRTLG